MNKIICNICGTSYPENATQCPICGFSRSSDNAETASTDNENTYQYVKGGRFSKSNVKKRNHNKQKKVKEPTKEKKVEANKPEKKGNGFMIAIAIIILLAIIAVVGYIALRFFLPNDYVFEGLDSLKEQIANLQNETEATEPEEVTTTSSDCTKVILDKTTLPFEGILSTYTLDVTVEPASTPDVITFASSDEAVCTVSETGLVTSVGEGSAVITVTCGSVSAECVVTCEIPSNEPELILNRTEITFTDEAESWTVYEGPIPVADITWTSDNSKVAKVSKGKIVAVSKGDTTIHATYGEQTVSCTVHCDFENKTYSLYNPAGRSDDVTIKVGSKFTLKLVDENKEEVKDADWSVNKSSVCSYSGSTVKALAAGTAKVTAEYKGKTYTCIVRVVK